MIHEVLDIFLMETHGVRRMDSASTVADAQLRMQKLEGKIPGEYLVLNQVTGNKLVFRTDQINEVESR